MKPPHCLFSLAGQVVVVVIIHVFVRAAVLEQARLCRVAMACKRRGSMLKQAWWHVVLALAILIVAVIIVVVVITTIVIVVVVVVIIIIIITVAFCNV